MNILNNKAKARVIAFYLPQFHPIPENDEWWGKGFTEWTNVGKAMPLYKGHYQPRVPADLGYYDLRLPEVREAQAVMARDAGIEAFCYWHYWFGNGKLLLERPFNEVLVSGTPDFPFCLGWANESWESKIWNSEYVNNSTILIKQSYTGEQDNNDHFNYLKKAFLDKRYIRIDNRPLFYIYRPLLFDDISKFIIQWNNLARENGISQGFYFVGQVDYFSDYEKLKKYGFNSVTVSPTKRMEVLYKRKHRLIRGICKYVRIIIGKPLIIEYRKAFPYFINKEQDSQLDVIPSVIPNWDHSPRSGINAIVLHNSTPELFKLHLLDALNAVMNKPEDKRIIFLKSWNEWAEGNYIEPDIKFGHGYLNVLREIICNHST